MKQITKLLLSSKNNIPVNTQLAVEIGLNEAIVLRQVYYWIEHYEAENKNFRDGKYWVYNSIKQWRSDNFPFMSEKTIERAFGSLKKKGLILVGDYSTDRMKRPNWYTINDEAFDNLIEKILGDGSCSEEKGRNQNEDNLDSSTECLNGISQNDCIGTDTKSECYIINNNINNTNSEITNRDYSSENTDMDTSEKEKPFSEVEEKYTSFPVENKERAEKPKSRYIPEDYTEEQLIEHIYPIVCDEMEIQTNDGEYKPIDEFLEVVRMFHRKFQQNTGKRHRVLADVSYREIVRKFLFPPTNMMNDDSLYDIECYDLMIDKYFKIEMNKYGNYQGKITKSLSHFMCDKVREYRYSWTERKIRNANLARQIQE